MARKKRKFHRKSHSRSRRMGAMHISSPMLKIIGIGGMAFLDNLAKKNLTLNPKTLGGIELLAGFFAPKLLNKALPEPYTDAICDGLIAVGTFNILKGFSVISGIGATPARVPLRRGAISPNMPAIGAAGRPFLNQNVGSMMPADMQEMAMGALFAED